MLYSRYALAQLYLCLKRVHTGFFSIIKLIIPLIDYFFTDSQESERVESFFLDWNITVIDKQYDPPSHKVFVHLRWLLPFSHVGIKQMLIWHNLDHTEQVDAGITGHIPKTAESTSEILKLAPNSEYRILVRLIIK